MNPFRIQKLLMTLMTHDTRDRAQLSEKNCMLIRKPQWIFCIFAAAF